MGDVNYTYILQCGDGSYYTGWTSQLARRIHQHQTKKGAKYTKSHAPVSLVCFETFRTREEAMRRECQIKKMTKKQKETLIQDPEQNEYLWSADRQKEKTEQLAVSNEKIAAVHKLTDNPFLNLYELDARTSKGKPFSYYFASRNKEDEIKIRTHSLKPEGIVIYAVKKGKEDKLVMVRQYRYPVNDYLYELPAGLVDKGESVETAARRELFEETGYRLNLYTQGGSSFRRPFFLAQGLTDETSSTVFGYTGKKEKPQLEDSEDMEVLLVSRAKAAKILAKERVSLRAAFLLMLFIQTPEGEPFAFLDKII